MNQEGVIISYLGDSPKKIFTAIAHLFFILFAHFVYIAHLTKFTKESSLLMEKSLLMEISKAEENRWLKKKETEKQAPRGNKEYHSVKKRKKSSVKATGSGVQILTKGVASKQNLLYLNFKSRFPSTHASNRP